METTGYPFFDCLDWKHEQSDVLQRVDPWARNAPKFVTQCERLPLGEISFLLCVPEAGVVPTSATESATV